MNIVEIIVKKKNKQELSFAELNYGFNGYLHNQISSAQVSALLMAIVINGMTYEETINLTRIFIDSGDVYDFSNFSKVVVDKHSTGGVGDSTTMIVGPLVACCGLIMAKMSGRGLGHTGGTIDKLESIPGFKTNLTKDEFMSSALKLGFCEIQQTDTLVPLDKVIYDLRNITGTTESIPLIASSIMSKKIACGSSVILIDIKVGSGALIKTESDADILSEWLIKIGKSFGRKVITIKTDMDTPLGNSIGNAIEVMEALEVLNNKNCRLKDISLEIASKLVSAAKNINLESAYKEVNDALVSKKALAKFYEFVKNQHGDIEKIHLEENVLAVRSLKDGKLTKIDALGIGELSVKLGVNKTKKTDKINYGAGIKLLKEQGDKVKKDEIIAYLYVPNKVNLTRDDFKCFVIEEE